MCTRDHIADCPKGHYVSVRLPDGRDINVYSNGDVRAEDVNGVRYIYRKFVDLAPKSDD
jgi:hypothetical protein